MVLTEFIETTWNGRNKSYYESLGYRYTGQRTKLIVKASDLNPTSHLKIEVSCDMCGKHNTVAYRDYVSRKFDNYLCSNCANILFGVETRRKQKLESSISFAEYHTNILGDTFLDKYWSLKNTLSPYEISYKSDKMIWLKCPANPSHPDYQRKCEIFSRGERCPICASKIVVYDNSLEKDMVSVLGDSYLTKWSKKNRNTPLHYTRRSGAKVWFHCEIHGDYQQQICSAADCDFHCPKCSQERNASYLQEKVSNYINSQYNYNLLHEQFCTLSPRNHRTGYKLRYDNEVKELSLIIEVHGQQHYDLKGFLYFFVSKGNTPEQEFEYLKERDLLKKNYAISHGYSYLEIPYWTEKDESYKTLIDDAIHNAKEKINSGTVQNGKD